MPLESRVALAALLLAQLACRTTSAPAAPVEPPPPAGPSRIELDVGALFPVATSRTVGDNRVVAPGLLARVALERNALVGTDGVEPWLARVLFTWLVTHGAVVQATDKDATARLVGVRFAVHREEAAVSIGDTAPDAWFVRPWAGKQDISNCAPAMKVPLLSVQLEAVLLDGAEREVAHLAEVVVVVPAEQKGRIDVGDDPCGAIVRAMDDAFAPGERELVAAANQALDRGFGTLVDVR